MSPAYLTPGYPATPVVLLLLVTVLLVLLAGNNPTQVLLGAGVVALGVPAYHILYRRKHHDLDSDHSPLGRG